MSRYPSPNAPASSTPGPTTSTGATKTVALWEWAQRLGGTANRDLFEPYDPAYTTGPISRGWEHALGCGAVRALFLGEPYLEVSERYHVPPGTAFAFKCRIRDADPAELLEEILTADAIRAGK